MIKEVFCSRSPPLFSWWVSIVCALKEYIVGTTIMVSPPTPQKCHSIYIDLIRCNSRPRRPVTRFLFMTWSRIKPFLLILHTQCEKRPSLGGMLNSALNPRVVHHPIWMNNFWFNIPIHHRMAYRSFPIYRIVRQRLLTLFVYREVGRDFLS